MEFYYVYNTTYHNDTRIGTVTGKILTDKEPQKEITTLTWENLNDWYYENGLDAKFNIWNFKKGRRINFFLDKLFPTNEDEKDIKEWKQKELNVRIETTYEKFNPCLADVLKWHDVKKAIIYLNERGLKIK